MALVAGAGALWYGCACYPLLQALDQLNRQATPDFPQNPRSSGKPGDEDVKEPLSAVLKRATQQAHRHAERSGVISQLINRQATREGYICYLRNLQPIYQSLEERLSRLREAGGYEVLTDPALTRGKAIESDLAVLAGGGWQVQIPLLDSAANYAQSVSRASTSQLLAHTYVRYLGDLNGGLIIKRLLRDSLALSDRELAFYDFPGIDDVGCFREAFRSELDSLETQLDNAVVVNEALQAFAMSTRLSIDIETHLDLS